MKDYRDKTREEQIYQILIDHCTWYRDTETASRESVLNSIHEATQKIIELIPDK